MKTKRYNNKGFTLLFSLVFLFLIIMACESYFLVASSGLSIASRTADTKRAYYAADAGLSDALVQMRGSLPPNLAPINNNNYAIGAKMGSYSVTLVSDNGTWPVYTVTSTGRYGSITKTLQLLVRQTSPSMFAYLSNSEVHPVFGQLWWITGMFTYGPVHSNGRLNIWGDPIFEGHVSQVAPTINYWPGVITDPADFRGGLTLGAVPKAVFDSTIVSGISSAAATGGLLLSGNSAITFNADGTINVTNSARGWTNQNMAVPVNKAIYVQGGSATVKGTVNGQVTVGSDNDIFISDNLIYNSDPDPAHPNPASTDVLALVAQRNVTVTVATAPASLLIEAVMVAVTGSFQVDNWWVQGKGNMLQYGSLINNVCGPTGVFDPGTGTLYGGYNQLQYFDPKLETTVPPCFSAAKDADGRTSYSRVDFKEL